MALVHVVARRVRLTTAWAVMVAAALALGAGAALAASYTIDTNDANVSEWSAQGVPIFTEDPVGDVLDPDGNPGAATDDIVRGWVASGVTPGGTPSLFFLVEMASAPAASTTNRAVVALIDCDLNGNVNERQDRWASYQASGFQSDYVRLYTGDQMYGLTTGSGSDKVLGQRVQRYLEWGVPISALPITGNEPPELQPVVDCKGTVAIRFASTQHDSFFGGPFTVLDLTEPLYLFDIPASQTFTVTLTIEALSGSDDARLAWQTTAPAQTYALLRSTEPFASFATITTTVATAYVDPGVLAGADPNNYFYQVQSAPGVPSTLPSNRVGLFKFALAPGEP